MNKISKVIKKCMFQIKYKSQTILFIISIFCFCIFFLKLYSIHYLIKLTYILFLFRVLIFLGSTFTILFLPTYPLFFFLVNKKDFKLREKIPLTITTNLSFYILIGFIGSFLNLQISFSYFLSILILSYFLIMLIVIFQRFKQKKKGQHSLVKSNRDYHGIYEDFSILNYIKKSISFNGVLLFIFIVLICMLNMVNTPFFAGTDPWTHVSIIKYITEINTIPYNEYYGALGLHIFSTVFHYFSGINLIILPKFFILYSLLLSSLIVYNLLRRIFKNNNLAIFGVYLLVFSSLGFSFLMIQFWPSSIALIQGLVIFFLLYVRLQSLTKAQIPKKETIFKNLLIYYSLLTFIFISSIITHSLIAMILLISYLWIYLIYFVKNYRRGFDFLLLVIFIFIFIIFFTFNVSVGHLRSILNFNILPWYYFLVGTIVGSIVMLIFLRHYRKSMEFTRRRFKLIITGKKRKIYSKIEEKYIFPLFFIVLVIFLFSFSITNLLIFNLETLSIFNGFEIVMLGLLAIWGIAVFQFKPQGKPLFLWGLALGTILLVGFVFDAAVGVSGFFSRIFYVSSIIISIGVVSYFYKLIKSDSIQKKKYKIFYLCLSIFSLVISFIQHTNSVEMFSIKNQEVNSVQFYTNHINSTNVIITEFGWTEIFIYYDYPFEDKNRELILEEIHYFLIINNQLAHPNLHISNNINILKNLKSFYNTDVILILPKEYYLAFSWQFFEELTEEETEAYYNLNYLNRIFSAKGEDGEETPYYWVI
jgi:hypothetical protein